MDPKPTQYEIQGRLYRVGSDIWIRDEAGGRYDLADLLQELHGKAVHIVIRETP